MGEGDNDDSKAAKRKDRSGSGSGNDSSPLASPRFLRPSLRNATMILPRTGERIKRSVTLSNTSSLMPNGDGPSSSSANHTNGTDPRTPLLLQPRRALKSRRSSTSSFRSATRLAACAYDYVTSPTGRSILKCSLSYLLGSMATFVPALANILGHQDGKHIVATVTVYFHSARSQGSMIEATLLAFAATLYASFIAFSSMGTSIGFARIGLTALGHAIVLIVFCGGGLGLVGWIKLRLSNPLVNVACSLTSLAIITVLTKEGSVQVSKFSAEKPVQVLKMVLMGIFATTAVCLLVDPVSARKELRKSMVEATDTLSELMVFITRSFLYEHDKKLNNDTLKAIESRNNKAFDNLTKHLREAKYEHYVLGTEKQYHLEVRIVDCMQRMAHDIGGLRSAAATQSTAQESAVNGYSTPENTQRFDGQVVESPGGMFSGMSTPQEPRPWNLSSIDELPEEQTDNGYVNSGPSIHSRQPSSDQPSQHQNSFNPAEISEQFISSLGPSMKSLAYTLKLILDELPFSSPTSSSSSKQPEEVVINPHFRQSLNDAQALYADSRNDALRSLYKSKDLNRNRPLAVVADFEEIAASCGHFSFSLQDFAEEVEKYLDILEEYRDVIERRRQGERSWRWTKFWKRDPPVELARGEDPERMALLERTIDLEMPATLTKYPKPRPYETKEGGSRKDRLRKRMYLALRLFRREDVKFAIKVGFGALLYALPAFLPSTRPFYRTWRGEWGLLSYMLVCSMTIGASNTTGFQRSAGTGLGALCAIVAWMISNADPFVLGFFGWLMSLGCFYIIVVQGKGPMGRYILLTYNLSALYAYSLSVQDDDHDDDEGGTDPMILPIALHRVVAVLTGCLWGMIVTRVIWPMSARRKLKNGLSLLWLRMGLIWKRDPLSHFFEDDEEQHPHAYMDLREELQLQQYLSELRSLRASAASEFELRGPFPDASFSSILDTTGDMLDAFHAMNVVIVKDLRASAAEMKILQNTGAERRQLSGRISHLFQVLASSMKLEYPINNALPRIEHTRDRLLARMFEFRKRVGREDGVRDDDFALLYAYALVTAQLAKGIDSVGAEIEKLFGILDEDVLKLQ